MNGHGSPGTCGTVVDVCDALLARRLRHRTSPLAELEQPSTAVRNGALKRSVRVTSGRARMRQERESLRWIGIECCSLVERSCSCCFWHTSLLPAASCLGNKRVLCAAAGIAEGVRGTSGALVLPDGPAEAD